MPLVFLQQDANHDNRFVVQAAGFPALGYLLQRQSGEVEAHLIDEDLFADRLFASLEEAIEEIQAYVGDE